MTVYVHVYAQAPSGAEHEVEQAYHQISRALAETPGLLGNTLLSDAGKAGRYLVVSEWASLAAFQEWEQGPAHRQQTAPLRPFMDPGPSGRQYTTVATYRGAEPA